MLRYRLTTPVKSVVIVSLDSDDQNKSARIEYEGDRLLIPTVQHWLERESGAFGHIIGTHTTPIDLDAAMKSKNAIWSPQIIEGEKLVVSYDPGIPPGAIT